MTVMNGVSIDSAGARQAVRFPAWTTLTVLSVVALVAIVSTTEGAERTSAEKGTIAVASLSLVFGMIGCGAYLAARSIFVGQIFETGLIFMLSAIWGFGLLAIMNPNKGIAVEGTQVSNANLYFASWGSFGACLYMAATMAQEYGVADVTKTPPKVVKWFILLASGVIVMGSATRIFKAAQCEIVMQGSFCRRTKFAISAGVLGCFSSAVMIILIQLNALSLVMELTASLILVLLWIFGIGYITFGISPGHAIGNMYFATWTSFIISILLVSECMRDYLSANYSNGQESTEAKEGESAPAPQLSDFQIDDAGKDDVGI